MDRPLDPSRRTMVVLAALTGLLLLPFIHKAFHIDDPLFLWVARQIRSHPLDFFGFQANWYGHLMPMAEINQNPPLASYYIALVSHIAGWGETALHTAFLLPAMAVVVATYLLATELTPRPTTAALVTLLSPVFLTSSTNLMSDTMMLAFYVGAILLWHRAVTRDSLPLACAAALLITLATLTKYFGISLIPLLALYTVAARRRQGLHLLLPLLLPVAVLAGYEVLGHHLYGHGLILHAAAYTLQNAPHDPHDLLARLLAGLAFCGAATIGAHLAAPHLWRGRRTATTALPLIAALFGAFLYADAHLALSYHHRDHYGWPLLLQGALLATAGLHALFLAGGDLWRRRDADAILLVTWVGGTFAFAAAVNWTTNGRAMMPLIPPVAILFARRLGVVEGGVPRWRPLAVPFSAAACLTLAVAHADTCLANAQRTAATAITHELRPYPGEIHFQGHWGFQYYMEQAGARAVDFEERGVIHLGDWLVFPQNSSGIRKPRPFFQFQKRYDFPTCSWLATMQPRHTGAGFYSTIWGPLPFVFGPTPPAAFGLYRALGG